MKHEIRASQESPKTRETSDKKINSCRQHINNIQSPYLLYKTEQQNGFNNVLMLWSLALSLCSSIRQRYLSRLRITRFHLDDSVANASWTIYCSFTICRREMDLFIHNLCVDVFNLFAMDYR